LTKAPVYSIKNAVPNIKGCDKVDLIEKLTIVVFATMGLFLIFGGIYIIMFSNPHPLFAEVPLELGGRLILLGVMSIVSPLIVFLDDHNKSEASY
jgi:hypothetical protein